MRNVYLKGFAVRGPALATAMEFESAVINSGIKVDFDEVRLPDDTRVEMARPGIPDHLSYLDKRDKKILSNDLIAAIDCARDVTQREIEDLTDLTEVPLYISTGVILDRILGDISTVITRIVESGNDAGTRNKAELVNESMPPLLGLRCLTNSINHFISKYTGLRGESTTYGCTSNSTASALRDGFYHVACGRGDYAVVGAVNEVGVLHSMTSRASVNPPAVSRESAASVFVVLASENRVSATGTAFRSRITDIGSYASIAASPSAGSHEYRGRIPDCDDDIAMITNAPERGISGQEKSVFSWRPLLGSPGVAGILLDLAAAQVLLENGSSRSAICLDKDSFGRENWLRLVSD